MNFETEEPARGRFPLETRPEKTLCWWIRRLWQTASFLESMELIPVCTLSEQRDLAKINIGRATEDRISTKRL